MEIVYRYLLAMLFLLFFLFMWQWIQRLAIKMAKDYPQFGPARVEGVGCGGGGKCGSSCGSKGDSCDSKDK